MSDFAHYERQGPRSGHTVAYEVKELRNPDGTHPVVHLEHLGRTNASFVEALLAEAGSEQQATVTERIAKVRDRIVRHCARKLERVYKADGTLATDADLPAFIHAMPLRAFEALADFAMSEANFCEYPIATEPQQLAEK